MADEVGVILQISRVLFRLFFAVLAVSYGLVLMEFLDPSIFAFDINVGADALIMSLLASLFVYFYMRKPKL